MTILDSGIRREYETGAVRDIQEGKGNCSLVPLDVVAKLMHNDFLTNIEAFRLSGDVGCLYDALNSYCKEKYENVSEMILEVSKHFEEGAKKYSPNNWRKGINVSSYVDSCVRHYLKVLAGYTDENHERAVTWNLMCGIWTYEHKPELDDYTVKNTQISLN